MTSQFIEQLRELNEYDNKQWNYHTYYPVQNWSIKDQEKRSLISSYCNLISSNPGIWDGTVAPPGLAQKVEDLVPVTFLFTLKFLCPSESDSKNVTLSSRATLTTFYDDKFVSGLVRKCQELINDNLIFDADEYLYCALLESPKPSFSIDQGEKHIVVMIKLQFPVSKNKVSNYNGLRKKLIKSLINSNLLSLLPPGQKNNWDQIVSPDVFSTPFLMYGSSSSREVLPLRFRCVVGVLLGTDNDINSAKIDLNIAFNPTMHDYFTKGLIDADMFSEGDEELWLPLYLSLGYGLRQIHLKEEKKEEIKQEEKRVHQVKLENKEMGDMNKIADELLEMIACERAEHTNEWMDVGRALYNLYNGSDMGLQQWIKFTKKHKQFHRIYDTSAGDSPARTASARVRAKESVATCDDLYPSFSSNRKITIATLAHYARVDSPDAYRIWHKRWCKHTFEEIAGNMDNEVAIAAYRYFWTKYLYAPCKTGAGGKVTYCWWYWNNEKPEKNWIWGDAALIALRKDMIDNFRDALRIFGDEYNSSSRDPNLPSHTHLVHQTIKDSLAKLWKKLGTLTYVDRIIKLMTLRFITYEDIPSLFDTNGLLTNCKNAVIEVIDDEARTKEEPAIRVRHIKPEDYLSMSTQIEYPWSVTWDHMYVKQVMRYMGQLFTNPECMNFAITLDASCLQAGNRDKILTTRVGGGNNSKTGHQSLIQQALGDYAKTVGTSILTGGDRRANEHTEEEASLRNARAAITCEPRAGERINTAKAKLATGNDRKYVRGMHEKGQIIDQTYKIYIFGNSAMRVTEVDQAIIRRLLVILYKSLWSENAPEDEAEQYKKRHFPANPDFDKKLKKWAPYYLWIMVKYFETYKSTKYLIIPDEVKRDTETYWRENDTYNVYINQRLTKTDETKSISFVEVWNDFTNWYNSCKYDKDLIPDSQRAMENMQQRLGQLISGRWVGWQLNRNAAPVPVQPQQPQAAKFQPDPVQKDVPNAYSSGHLSHPVQVQKASEVEMKYPEGSVRSNVIPLTVPALGSSRTMSVSVPITSATAPATGADSNFPAVQPGNSTAGAVGGSQIGLSL